MSESQKSGSDEVLKELDTVFDRVANILLKAVQKEMGDRLWASAHFDVRGGPGGDARLQKLRVTLPSGEVVNNLHSPIESGVALTEAYDLRARIVGEPWYGVLITIYPDGRVSVAFNYDPNCAHGFFGSGTGGAQEVK